MRLLHAESITLELFFDDRDIPPYAVLSHTWGAEEVTLQDMLSGSVPYKSKEGFKKIEGCCLKARQDGLDYVWVDTCCIDKSSSAELSEAINSMFRWYENARVCYAYLVDVAFDEKRQPGIHEEALTAYQSCRWFTRGWTLQELLAPKDIRFFDAGWNSIGSKSTNLGAIEKITGIGRRFLKDVRELRHATVAQRMSWAAGRKTTRREDQAYCLFGLFGINMPLLYGEGEKAFIRLQEEIMKESDDQSLFVWDLGFPLDSDHSEGGLLAPSPDAFTNCGAMVFWGQLSSQLPTHYYMTNKGLRIELPLVHAGDDTGTVYAVLDCFSDTRFVGLPLSQGYHTDVYQRAKGSIPRPISANVRKRAVRKIIYLQKHLPGNSLTMYFSQCVLGVASLKDRGYSLVDAYPPHAILKIGDDNITCGDSHQTILLFQQDDRHLLALLITATYQAVEHELSRPVLKNMSCQVAAGLKSRRFVKMVVDHGLSGVPKVLRFRDTLTLGQDLITTIVREKSFTGWTMSVEINSVAPGDERRDVTALDNSDSDDMEHVSRATMAAMFNNNDRDFRQRQSWVQRQKRPMLSSSKTVGALASLVGLLAGIIWKYEGIVTTLSSGTQLWVEDILSNTSYLFEAFIGVIVVASFMVLSWRPLRRLGLRLFST